MDGQTPVFVVPTTSGRPAFVPRERRHPPPAGGPLHHPGATTMRIARRSPRAGFAAPAALSAGMSAPASAAPVQEGLVNVNVSDVVIAVPVSVAANICDVSANVLATQ